MSVCVFVYVCVYVRTYVLSAPRLPTCSPIGSCRLSTLNISKTELSIHPLSFPVYSLSSSLSQERPLHPVWHWFWNPRVILLSSLSLSSLPVNHFVLPRHLLSTSQVCLCLFVAACYRSAALACVTGRFSNRLLGFLFRLQSFLHAEAKEIALEHRPVRVTASFHRSLPALLSIFPRLPIAPRKTTTAPRGLQGHVWLVLPIPPSSAYPTVLAAHGLLSIPRMFEALSCVRNSQQVGTLHGTFPSTQFSCIPPYTSAYTSLP